jgi:flavorubredoxin
MKAIVVYESHWGSTAAVARAIAEGMGHDVPALDTDDAYRAALAGVDLIVAGAPVIAFGLPRLGVRRQLAGDVKAPRPADLSHPLLREWLDVIACGRGWAAAFETRIWWSPRGATRAIESKLRQAGYARIAKAERFIVGGAYGPLREGELARARVWGATLAALLIERLAAEKDAAAPGGSQHPAYRHRVA